MITSVNASSASSEASCYRCFSTSLAPPLAAHWLLVVRQVWTQVWFLNDPRGPTNCVSAGPWVFRLKAAPCVQEYSHILVIRDRGSSRNGFDLWVYEDVLLDVLLAPPTELTALRHQQAAVPGQVLHSRNSSAMSLACRSEFVAVERSQRLAFTRLFPRFRCHVGDRMMSTVQ